MTLTYEALYAMIKENITGRIGITEEEGHLLHKTINHGDLYLEVGCLWGGTSILAADKADRVITIDFMMGGFWDSIDPVAKRKPSATHILDNFTKFRVAHKVSIIKDFSYPFPLPPDIQPDVFLIDGGHSYECALQDWNTAREITKRAILLHDFHRGNTHKGVWAMGQEVAMKDPEWELTDHVQSMGLFTRRE